MGHRRKSRTSTRLKTPHTFLKNDISQDSSPTLNPSSPPNIIGVSLVNGLSLSQPLHPQASIRAVDDVLAFTLKSVRYGCFLNGVNAGSITTIACTITAWGYTIDGKQTSTEILEYVPDSLTNATMATKEFVGFGGLRNVTFAIRAPVLVGVLALDDVRVCRYYK